MRTSSGRQQSGGGGPRAGVERDLSGFTPLIRCCGCSRRIAVRARSGPARTCPRDTTWRRTAGGVPVAGPDADPVSPARA